MNAPQRVPSFNEKLALAVANVTYRVARTEAERDAIFALRYKDYLRDGGIGPNASERFSDPWDEAENALLIGMYYGDRLASSVRFHMNRPAEAPMPAKEIFADVLKPFLDAGLTVMDPTRFVIDPDLAHIGPELPYLTLRMIAMAAEHYRADIVLATIRQEHLIVYKHIVGHTPISEPRSYPLLARKIVCTKVDIEHMRATAYRRHPFLDSTAQERERIFGRRDETRLAAESGVRRCVASAIA
ncbi:MAG: hypothetical protein KGM42_20570 [Hyphomicrobiales bacterium]|nr:hypothetical protein [Hyphomicrobiales bacterium]